MTNRAKQIFGGSSLGLSAAAVIWLYHTFVPVHQYDKDQASQEKQNTELWHELHQLENKPK